MSYFFTFPVTAAQKLLKSVKVDIVAVKCTLPCFHGAQQSVVSF